MKRLVKIAVCLASALALNAGARADDGVLPNNPYAPIVVRNVFGLNPPPPADAGPPGDPPPKITPNGIMSILGQVQVLFKVAGTAKPGQPAKDEFYILSEGQRQDEIEVTHIDEKANLVTFNNHGTVQELPLANAPAVSTPMPARAGPVAVPNVNNSGRIPGGRLGGRAAGGHGAARNLGRGDASPAPSLSPSQQQSQNTMPVEAQALMIEVNRALTQDAVNNGSMPPLPPTALTPPDATGHGGSPLIVP